MPHLHHVTMGSSGPVFLTLILFSTAVVYLRKRLSSPDFASPASTWRAISFFAGLFLIWLAMASQIAALDHELLTIHMLQHLLLMTIAPPLILLGVPIRPLVPSQRSRAANRFSKILQRPDFAWLAACATLVGWHIPILFALGMQSVPWHLFEQLSFLATGLLFWWPVIRQPADAAQRDFSLILYLFLATLPCDILSGFLAFSDRVVYPIYFSSSHLMGFSPLVDQQCAAALMWTCVTIVYLVAGAILTVRLLSPQDFPRVGLAQPDFCGTEIGSRTSHTLRAH